MTQKERKIVYEKYGGRCAYCGCELQKGWHVDHVEPCRRITEWQGAGYAYPNGKLVPREELRGKTEGDMVDAGIKWKEGRYVTIGYANPDAHHIDNYMPSCPPCNINKHGDTIEQFREAISGYLHSLNLRMVQYKMVKKYGLVEETNKPVVFYFEMIHTTQTTIQ
jgi:5-methylcytosine-specific restriction endonuclease McrA